ncbi:hypothetical protein [Microbulbifer discodermiae]|uniref:hypothetical protein n=1 Tax=Microbulbifer sp. 2201CG32-9 TaxID=3232309 RepID=UPI00345BB8E5
MEATMDITMAKKAYQKGNLKSVLLTPANDSDKWIMRFQLTSNGREVLLNGAKRRLRQFATIPTALKVAKTIGFEKVEVAFS